MDKTGMRMPDDSMAEEILVGLSRTFPVIKRLFGVKKIGIFGTFARRDGVPRDSLELIVEFSPGFETFHYYLGLKWHLEEQFLTPVRLITTRMISDSPGGALNDPSMGDEAGEAVREILGEIEFIRARSRDISADAFGRDILLRHAIERSLERIGTAAGRIGAGDRDLFPGVPWEELEGIGRCISEARPGTDSFIVWHYISAEIPVIENRMLSVTGRSAVLPRKKNP